jgi:hypothetical protein
MLGCGYPTEVVGRLVGVANHQHVDRIDTEGAQHIGERQPERLSG